MSTILTGRYATPLTPPVLVNRASTDAPAVHTRPQLSLTGSRRFERRPSPRLVSFSWGGILAPASRR
jgi:hypothetical protein